MSTKKDHESLLVKVEISTKPLQRTPHYATPRHGKSAKQLQSDRRAKGKNSAAHWQDRIYKPVTRGVESPHYTMQVAHKGRRMAFTTGTGNRDAAAQSAAGIYRDLLSLGTEATLAKHRPQKAKGDKVATVGQWIISARTVSEVNDATFNQYAASLRKIAGDILSIKKTKSRFGPKTGGAAKYRAVIDALSLEALTPLAIQKWRMAYVKKAKNPKQESSAKTSCNSTIRQAKSLFAPKVADFMKELRLPVPAPFAGVKFYERQNSRYSSRIDIADIGTAAHTQLASTDPQAFLAFLLAIGAGLRRGEIDSLCWHQVDTKKCLIRVEVTESASLKTTDSVGEVDIDEDTATLLQGYKARAKAKDRDYVIMAEGRKEQTRGPHTWGQHYRANSVFDALVAWLRNYEQDGQKPLAKVIKPIHELRKELGALMAQQHGIYAASRALRHSNVATTAAHYADKKARSTIAIGRWLTPKNVVSITSNPAEVEPQKDSKSRTVRNSSH
jgi:integrase